MALADVTGDGRADVVVSSFDGFAIFSEVTPTSLGPSVKVAAPKGEGWDPVAADLDGDGRAEVIRLTSYEGAFVYAYPGTPSQAVTPIPGSTGLSVLRIADMDGDGRLDLVGASSDDNKGTLRVFRGLDGGGFEALPPSKIPSSVLVADIAVGDVDGNGTPDVVVLFSTAKGSVREAVFRDPLSTSTLPEIMLDPEAPGCDYLATSIGIGDLDGDGRNDIVTTRTQQSLGTNMGQILVRYQAKDGSMGPSDYVFYDSYVPPDGSTYPDWFGPVIVADGDGDGRADVLATSSNVDLMLFQGPKGLGGPDKTVWHPNGGHGAFNSIAIGDIDCDGRDELVRSSSVKLTVTFGAP